MSPSYFAAAVGLQMKLNWLSTLDKEKQMVTLPFEYIINVMQALKSRIQLKLNQISGIVASLGLHLL